MLVHHLLIAVVAVILTVSNGFPQNYRAISDQIVRATDRTILKDPSWPNIDSHSIFLLDHPDYLIPGKANLVYGGIVYQKNKGITDTVLTFSVKKRSDITVRSFTIHNPEKIRIL